MSYLFTQRITPTTATRYVLPAMALLGLGFALVAPNAAKRPGSGPSMQDASHEPRQGSSERARARYKLQSAQRELVVTHATSDQASSPGTSRRAQARAEARALLTKQASANAAPKSEIPLRRRSRGAR